MKLSEKDQTTYLANLIFVANADGRPSLKKAAAIEETRLAIGAKKNTFEAAAKLARTTNFALIKLDSFVAEASNIADIIYVSIVDGGLSDQEKKAISDLSKISSLTDQQFILLTREAIARIKAADLSIACPACNAAITGDSRFCPKCGAALETAAKEAGEFEIPVTGYAIEFCESTSADFPTALKYAQSAPTFSSTARNKKTWYLAAWPEQSLADAANLAELIGSLRNRRCYYKGAEAQWDELFGFVGCADERNKAYQPVHYCFGKDQNRLNPWGCIQSGMDWTEWARWFSYGRFERQGLLRNIVWIFDKKRIRHEVVTNLYRFRFCPNMRPRLIEAVIEALPDKVEVTEKGNWKYGQSFEEVPGSIKIVERQKTDGYELTHEYYADGVRPKGPGQLEEILSKAFRDAGIDDVKVIELTR